MRILPVLDLLRGQVVRAFAGRRHEYQPLQTPLAESSDPLSVARGFRQKFNLNELYVADLDAIAGRPPSLEILQSLHADGFALLLDAGLRSCKEAVTLLDAKVAGLVAGLETLAGPNSLGDIFNLVSAPRLVFSLDLRNGKPIMSADWGTDDPFRIVVDAVKLGVRRVLVLDLAKVGIGTGAGTEELLTKVHAEFPRLELLAGGGVRGTDDLRRLEQCGVSVVLIASALHDGKLRADDLDQFRRDSQVAD